MLFHGDSQREKRKDAQNLLDQFFCEWLDNLRVSL